MNSSHLFRGLLAVIFLVVGSLALPARAAESYDNCTGFIDSLPATIATQGNWCLRQNLSTAMTSGAAITIATNNVTIDCNDFKIGGLAAGDSSTAYGIHASNRQNATVRHCGIRGFYRGINLIGGAGHLVEDNRLDNSLWLGMWIEADHSRVQRNRVYDTGGSDSSAYGLIAMGVAIDNTVAGVFGVGTNTYPTGIQIRGHGSEARGNRVLGLVVQGSGFASGIEANGNGIRLNDNHVTAVAITTGSGLGNQGSSADTFCIGNTVLNFTNSHPTCEHVINNLAGP